MSACSFDITASALRIAGLEDFDSPEDWAARAEFPDPKAKGAPCGHLPMMQARRLKTGSRMAADAGFELLAHDPDFIVYSSRHGELERNFSILSALSGDDDVSPTDFSMSVHNASAGVLTVTSGRKIPLSSISAGTDSFVQALFESVAALNDHERVLLVDFDGAIPEFFMRDLPSDIPRFPYAAGFIVARGGQWSIGPDVREAVSSSSDPWPQSLSFMRHLLRGDRDFLLAGEFESWRLVRTEA